MRIRPLLAVLSTALVGALGVTSAASAAPAGPQPIIGGGTVSSAPWAAAVLSNGSFTCSGSVIAAQWVLTARHCISGTMSVRVGSVNRTSGGVTRTVSATYTRNDLALMRLAWRGDSGGPQFYNGQQVGVASTADGSSIQNYGSVAYNRAWITSVAGV